jgi:hypothetical protein
MGMSIWERPGEGFAMSLRDVFEIFAEGFGIPGSFGPSDHQIFVSKSGEFREFRDWINILRSKLDKCFNLIWDDEFRVLGGQGYYDHWRLQFEYTRASYAMLVLMDPNKGTSRGQDVEIEDAMGRGIPIAFCRTQKFATNQLNESFRNM